MNYYDEIKNKLIDNEVYEKVKEIDVVRELNENFFAMMEMDSDIKKL